MTLEERFWSKVDIRGPDECWEWTVSRSRQGYGQFRLGGKTEQSHRIAYWLAIGDIPDGLIVCHSCDNPGCCNPDHLFLGTNQDNADDKVAKGRQAHNQGADNGRAKLDCERISKIKKLYWDEGRSKSEIARRFGVGRSTIRDILNGDHWIHCQEKANANISNYLE